MKTIKIVGFSLFTTLFLTIFNSICNAQAYKKSTFSTSIGAEVIFTETKLSKTNKTGGGVNLKGEYVFSNHSSATMSGGYYFLQKKEKLNEINEDISAIPLKVGLRYYLASFYGGGEAGSILFMGDNSSLGFLYSLGIGDKFKVRNNVFDIGLRHEGWTTNSDSRGIIALRLAYEFALNK